MAGHAAYECSGSDVSVLIGLFSDDIDGILAKLDTHPRCDVIDELADGLDMSTLMGVREKVFRYAKRKLVSSVEEPGNVDIDPAMGGTAKKYVPGDAQRIVDEWVLIARKGKTRVAMDTVEFMSYLSGAYTYFPIKSTKKRVVKAKKGRKKKPYKRVDPEQPRISFPAKDKDVQSKGDEDNGSGSESDCEEDGDISEADYSTASSGATQDENLDSDDPGSPADTVNAPSSGSGDPVDVGVENCNDESSTAMRVNLIPVDPGSSIQRAQTATDTMGRSNGGDAMTTGSTPIPDANQTSGAVAHEGAGTIEYDDKTGRPTQPNPTANETTSSAPAAAQSIQSDPRTTADSSKSVSTSVPTLVAPLPVTMATQTGWDLWGSPESNNSFMLTSTVRKSSCECGPIVKQLKERLDVLEKRCENNDSQSRTRMNIVRQKLMQSEDDRTKMKATIASLTKQIANNSATMTEMKIQREEGRGFTSGEMLRRPTGPQQQRPSGASNGGSAKQTPKQRGGTSAQSSQGRSTGSDTMSADLRNLRQIPLFQSPTVRRYGGTDVVHAGTTSGPVSKTNGQNTNQSKQGGRQSSYPQPSKGGAVGNSAMPTTRAQQPKPPPTARYSSNPGGGPGKGPLPARQGSTQPFASGSASRSQNTTRTVSTSAPPTPSRQTREAASDSWADDPLSDADIIAIADESDRNVASGSNPDAASGATESRMSILRDAINESVQKGLKPKPGGATNAPSARSPIPGDKRRSDDPPDQDNIDPGNTSYAEVAADGDWSDWETKRRRRNSPNNRVPDLYGVRQIPHKDIFVRHLNYSSCRKPEDLELIVKFHCRRRKVDIIFAKAFVQKNDLKEANCKVSVKESDIDLVLSKDFWPEYATARLWLKPWSHHTYVHRAGCLRAVYGRNPWRSQDHLAGASRSWPQT